MTQFKPFKSLLKALYGPFKGIRNALRFVSAAVCTPDCLPSLSTGKERVEITDNQINKNEGLDNNMKERYGY